MLKIENLTLEVDNKEILNNFNIELEDGKINVIMGPNGIGKSSICAAIMRNPKYIIKKGSIKYNDKDLTKLNTTDIAREGIFLLSQSPLAIEGVSNADMLRNALAEKTGEKPDLYKFNKEIQEVCEKLSIPKSFIHRNINDGMSGGEKKKNELMHLWMLKPNFIILDELDSGLDTDALKICANSIKEYYKEYKPSILIITHHTKILDILKPDNVFVLNNKKIDKIGDIKLAKEIEENGFNI